MLIHLAAGNPLGEGMHAEGLRRLRKQLFETPADSAIHDGSVVFLSAAGETAEAEKIKADIIAVSALMTSTLGGQKDVIDFLEQTGVRTKYIVMVGGGPTNQEWADEIGADGYAETAPEAVRVAAKLIEKRRN